MTYPRRFLLFALAALLLGGSPAFAQKEKGGKGSKEASKHPYDEKLFESLTWREVGPYRGGRSAAVTGVPSQPNVYYFGSTGGGVWKTTDSGISWKNVSDGFFGGSIGAVAVAASDPNVVYVGGGEKTVRGNVSHGEGMWKSTDAGATWKHVGLPDSRHIPRVRVHPTNPDLVYAAVLGHLFGPNEERGVYRSRDGGRSWQRVLFANRDAGAVDLILDPGNPRILYASTWRVRRTPYSLESGGPGSALWKSTDGGDNWTELSVNAGFPKGTLGIIGITVSPSNPRNLYALVEAEAGGLFRSRDGGATWTLTSDSRDLRQRAWYYTRLNADPADEDTVYVLNVDFLRSKDGGKSFTEIPVPHGDNHDLWIAPDDPRRMIQSNDGGANVSTDAGVTWTGQDNQPTAQFYRVSADDDFPYRLLGGQQDNSTVRIRSRSFGPGIGPSDWEPTAGGESGYVVAQPGKPDVVFGGSYGGFLTRVDHETGEVRDVNPWPDNPMGWGAAELKYRFQWNFPILFSPHAPHPLYAAAQVLFRSDDGGASWQPISPDLTRNDKSRQGPSGGPITKDNTSVEYYATIFAVAESPLQAGLIWAGSDDGLVHLTRDGGKNWTDVTPKGLPEWIQVNAIEASPFEPGAAYVAATMYKSDDFRPYLYKTTDFGATWTRINDGIADDHFTRVVRADPGRRGLLYAGTERGLYVSFDDGKRWQPFQRNLPIVPVTDLLVEQGDLIAATQGRGFWILDDLALVHQLDPALAAKERTKGAGAVHLFTPEPARRLPAFGRGAPSSQGTNPPNGVVFHYRLGELAPETKVKLEILGPPGTEPAVIRAFEGKVEPPKAARDKEAAAAATAEKKTAEEAAHPSAAMAGEEKPAQAPETGDTPETPDPEKADRKDLEEAQKRIERQRRREEEEKLPAAPGMNRFVWDLRYPPAEDFEGMVLWGGGTDGPRVVPGAYRARLSVEGSEGGAVEVPVEVQADPRSSSTPADLAAQHAFLRDVQARLSTVHREIRKIRAVRAQLTGLRERLAEQEAAANAGAGAGANAGANAGATAVRRAARELDRKMTAVEEALYQTKNRSRQDPLNYPVRLNDKLAAVGDSAAAGDFAPTAQQVAVKEQLSAAIDAELAKLRAVWEQDLPAFNRLAAEQGIAAVLVQP
jgi:photosystem II stability/assembly factor-like uncharacterized protein